MPDSSPSQLPTSTREDEAILVLRKWMCCRAGQEQVWRELIVPFAHTLVTDEMVARLTTKLFNQGWVFPLEDARDVARDLLSDVFSTSRPTGGDDAD